MELTIAAVSVRKDAEGRFSLNDLHVASGAASARGSAARIFVTAMSASVWDSGLRATAQYASMAWESASNPVASVSGAGIPSVQSGRMTAALGKPCS